MTPEGFCAKLFARPWKVIYEVRPFQFSPPRLPRLWQLANFKIPNERLVRVHPSLGVPDQTLSLPDL
jgi:hypothetical protein